LIRVSTWLRYAGGAALYGEQGVNGVIIVTTVKGKQKGKITVNVNSAWFETVSLCQTQNKYGQGWDGVHYLAKTDLGDFLLMVLRPTG
jgi:hypothetical protein